MTNRFCVIPARFLSSRFPGKPLVNLHGKPMIAWVAHAAASALGRNSVIVATDDYRIRGVAENFGFNVRMTSAAALTGTDRVAEVVRQLGLKGTILNVQGDEPLVLPEDILKIARKHEEKPHMVANGFSSFDKKESEESANVPKVVMNQSGNLLYASRSLIPGSKLPTGNHKADLFKKQVCIYAYSPDHLARFEGVGRKTPLESREDIEVLRFLEIGVDVQMVETSGGSLAVDEPDDIKKVEDAIGARGAKFLEIPE